MTARTLTLRNVCRQLGIDLPKLRRLAEKDETFPPVEWTGPRSGFVFREDFDAWVDTRHERAASRREQHRRGMAFLCGKKTVSEPDYPDFLKTNS